MVEEPVVSRMTRVSICDLTWGSCPQVSLFILTIRSKTCAAAVPLPYILKMMNTMRMMLNPTPSYLGMTPVTACILVRAMAA